MQEATVQVNGGSKHSTLSPALLRGASSGDNRPRRKKSKGHSKAVGQKGTGQTHAQEEGREKQKHSSWGRVQGKPVAYVRLSWALGCAKRASSQLENGCRDPSVSQPIRLY